MDRDQVMPNAVPTKRETDLSAFYHDVIRLGRHRNRIEGITRIVFPDLSSLRWVAASLLLLAWTATPCQDELALVDFAGDPIGVPHRFVTADDPLPVDLVTFTGVRSDTLALVSGMQLRRPAFDGFVALKKAAARENIHLHCAFAYRSHATQAELLRQYGPKRAEKPGYSEHHLGTTVDITRLRHASEGFLWLLRHGLQAGWAPTYFYRENSGFMREPWHWRFVGEPAAAQFQQRWRREIRADLRLLSRLKKQGKLSKNPYLAGRSKVGRR